MFLNTDVIVLLKFLWSNLIVDFKVTGDVSSSQSGHIILGEESFQTVTIVPTETNPGEVSYVLIVQQPDEGGEKEKPATAENEDADLTVYDFDDAEDPAAKELEVNAYFYLFFVIR